MIKIDDEKKEAALVFFTAPKLSRLKVMVYTASIIYSILMYDDPAKIIASIAWMSVLLMFGMTVGDVKALLGKLKGIMLDPDMSLKEKYNASMEVVLTGCAVVGAIHEEINAIDGIDHLVKKVPEAPEVKTEIQK